MWNILLNKMTKLNQNHTVLSWEYFRDEEKEVGHSDWDGGDRREDLVKPLEITPVYLATETAEWTNPVPLLHLCAGHSEK